MKILDKVLIASVVGAPALVHASADRHLVARQNPPAQGPSSSSTPPTGTGVSPPAPSTTGSTAGTVTGTPRAPTNTPSISLASTNPTAVPLSEIVSNAATIATRPLDFTATVGTTPTFLPGAPPLPDSGLLVPANYPTLDKVPPTDSPEVQQWISEVANTGVIIPNIPPTAPGGCAANPDAAKDTNRCWWTCGGCVRDTDIAQCPTHMQWGLTYDDGPGFYTPQLLDYLEEQKLQSTFFVIGSRVIQFPSTLQSEFMQQHQVGLHTWSHPPLTTLTNEQIIAELGWTRKAIKDVLGVTPNMMRPPFGDIDDRVRAISVAMGLIPVMWTSNNATSSYDTDDFNIHGGSTTVDQVLTNWENILIEATQRESGFIVLEHDLWQQTVQVATGYILPDALAQHFEPQPVVRCMGRVISDAYIETNNNQTNPPVVTPGATNANPTTLYPDGFAGSVQTVSAGSGSGNSGGSGSGSGSSDDDSGAYGASPSIVSAFLALLGLTVL